MALPFREEDVESVNAFGELDGQPVQLLRTRGGFCIAMGRPSGGESRILGQAGHPAVVRFALERAFPNFRPMMAKAEHHVSAESCSHMLSKAELAAGFDAAIIHDGVRVDLSLIQGGREVLRIPGEVREGYLHTGKPVGQASPKHARSLALTLNGKAASMGLKGVKGRAS